MTVQFAPGLETVKLGAADESGSAVIAVSIPVGGGRGEWAISPLFVCGEVGQHLERPSQQFVCEHPAMALTIETIRATADRVAASFGLEVVEVEFQGAGKHRALRVYVEKDAAGRARLAEQAASDEGAALLPQGVPIERLSGTTHEDCEVFARDFGTVLDVEDLVPGAEYTLEVSSPGLERKLTKPADYERFRGSLVKVQTFAPVENSRQFTGRLMDFDGAVMTINLSAVKQKGKGKKHGTATASSIRIALSNVERAQLVVEI